MIKIIYLTFSYLAVGTWCFLCKSMRRRSPIWVYISTNVENAASLTLAVGSESKLTIEARNFVTVKLWAPYLKTFEKLSFYKSHIAITPYSINCIVPKKESALHVERVL